MRKFQKLSLVLCTNRRIHINTRNNTSLRQSFPNGKSIDFTVKAKGIDAVKFDHINNTSLKQQPPSYLSNAGQRFFSFIMPAGYPSSVADGYLRYVVANMLGSALSTIGGVLSMQSLLFAIGLGAGAIPAAAALNWVIKDGLGQFGGVLFASVVGNKFDTDPKRWRVVSAVAMEAACLIEILTPLASAHFLLLASVANVSKNIAFLSASASRAAIHQSFAIYQNLADITAKSGSQSILASMLGTGLGVGISAAIANDFTASVAIFSVCSLSSVALSFYALQNVTVKTVSLARLDVLFEDYISGSGLLAFAICNGKVEQLITCSLFGAVKLLTPQEVRLRERFLSVERSSSLPPLLPLHIGAPLDQFIANSEEYDKLRAIFNKLPFLVAVRPTQRSAAGKGGKGVAGQVFLNFEEHASARDVLDGHFVAYVVRRMLLLQQPHYNHIHNGGSSDGNTMDEVVLRATELVLSLGSTEHSPADDFGRKLLQDEKCEWKVTSGMLQSDDGRYLKLPTKPPQ
jgi:hypothetical protein